ncbi:putative phloem protein [Helianthus debilis subsp. tardiflorus]
MDTQEDFEIWEPKLPRDYKEIMRLSQSSGVYKKKDIYKKLSNGILLPNEKVWFVLSDNGEANKMISATTAKYSSKNHESHKFRSMHTSRFKKVAKVLDITNLKIQVTIDNRFLSTDVIYGIYLVFKFSGPIIFTSKRMYMNLKYKNGNETFHSYFATRRDEEWMMIELHRFLNHKEDVSFTFLLESFSRCYCPSGAIFIEGIEYRAIQNMAHEDNKNQKQVQQGQKSNSDLEQVLAVDQKMFLREFNGKNHLMLSATEVLYNTENLPFRSKSSVESRFQNVTELLRQQVFRIKYKIKTEMLSPFTEYTCYLVFKVSKKCQGLHCPVKVRNLLLRKNKGNQIIYFRTPSHLNHHDDFWIPEQRKDGWMEVMIWKFNSKYNNNLGKDVIPMNLKLVTYVGTMSGLIICGLEFRPT